MSRNPLFPFALIILPFTSLIAGGWASDSSQPSTDNSAVNLAAPPGQLTRVQMRNVDFDVDRQVPLRIARLNGTMRSDDGGTIRFDDKNSFIISIDEAEIRLTGADLTVLLNKYVFNYRGSPVSNLRVSITGNQIVQTGTLRKVGSMPFEIRGALSVTPDGRLRIHPTRTRILGFQVDRLMKGLGLPLEKILDFRKARGISVQGNDMLLSPGRMMPPPRIEGQLTNAAIEGDGVVLTYRSGSERPALAVPDTGARSYMYYRGGTVRFGRLVMLDADMFITDLDPNDPFQFDLDRYQAQLVAGYSRTLPNGGLEVWMRDVDKLRR